MQKQEADLSPEQLSFVASQMRMQKSTIIASISGIYFDSAKADVEKRLLEMEYLALRRDILDEMNAYLPEVEWNPDSPLDIGTILFGGYKSVVKDEPVLDAGGLVSTYKSGLKKGRVKTKKTVLEIPVKAMEAGEPSKTAGGQWKVDEGVLKTVDSPFTWKILDLRDLKKQYTTYYESLIKYSASYDQRIHPQYNHCITATGRLSSSKPNLQNIRGEHGNT
jgi:DNA polymerase I-like protein with 3'-5' exonuclease and polymerase domains